MEQNPFGSAPSNHSGAGNLARNAAGFLGASRLFKDKGGVDAKQTSQLMNQQHTQNVQRDVLNHVLGQKSQATAHRQKTNQIKTQGDQDRQTSTHHIDHFERLGSSQQFSALNVGKSGISGTFRTPPSNDGGGDGGVGGASPAVNLDSPVASKSPKFRARG